MRTLADALVPAEFRSPPRPRKPYLPAWTPITCEMGHDVGTVAGDLPRRGDRTRQLPEPMMDLKQPYLGWNGVGGRLDSHHLSLDTLLRAWWWENGRWPTGWRAPGEGQIDVLTQPIPRGRCRICGERFFRFILKRSTGEPHAFQLHTPKGWGRA